MGFISGCTGADREETNAASSELVEQVRKVKVCRYVQLEPA